MLISSCALRCYCIQGQHVSAILCTNHCRSHADENFVAPSTYHQISKGVDGDERERYMDGMLITAFSLQTGPDEPVGFVLLKELVEWF